VDSRRVAFDFKRSLDQNNPDGSLAMQNANCQVELAAMKFRQALRDFVSTFDMAQREADHPGLNAFIE
jgi:hypothetical protein